MTKKEIKKIIIAIDGYSSCGKSTLAKQLASKLSYKYIDTGAMYRAFTLYCMENNIYHDENLNQIIKLAKSKKVIIDFKFSHLSKKSFTYLNGVNVEDKIRDLEVAEKVSKIAKIKAVREKMVYLQREMGRKKAIIMDGRDIGSTVFPNAEIKFFITSSQKIRAQRRYKELAEKNAAISFESVLKNISSRDFDDVSREENPLKLSKDAFIIDNSEMNLEQQFTHAFNIVKKHVYKLI